MLRSRTVSLEDVLRILPLDAKDTIVDYITMQRWDHPSCRDSIKRTRLACRALRDLVDGSRRSVDLTLRDEDEERLGCGQLPPLHRWPRCSRVRFSVSSDLTPSAAGAMVGLAVGGLPLEARRGVTELWLPGHLPAVAFAYAFMSLPALQSVSFVGDLSSDPVELRLVFHGLASLPHLTELRIDLGPPVNYLPMLAGSNLTSLHVSFNTGELKPDANMVASISKLDKLQRLEIVDIHDTDLLRLLMRSLPPTIQTLELYCCGALCEVYLNLQTTEVEFHEGFISAIKSDVASFGRLAQLVCKMAPGASNGAVAVPPPKSFHVGSLIVTGSEEGTGPDAVALKQLLQRCADVKVDTVLLQKEVAPKWVMEVAPLFGGTEGLILGLRGTSTDLRICTEALWPAVAAAAGEDDGGAGGLQPVGPSLIELALDRMSAAGAHATGPSAAAKYVQQPGSHVLLRGPSLASLASDPDALKDCMQMLAAQAQAGAAAAAAAAALATAPPEQCCVLSYLALPPPPPSRSARQQGAVLVRCTTTAAAAALVQAVAVLAEAGTLGAGKGGAEEPAGELLAQPVTLGVFADSGLETLDMSCLEALEQAAQHVCDGKGPGADWSGRQRLRWLLEEWTFVREWPETVYMD